MRKEEYQRVSRLCEEHQPLGSRFNKPLRMKNQLRTIDWRKYRNRLTLLLICFGFIVMLLLDVSPSQIDLIKVSGHLKTQPQISTYGGDVPKTVIEVKLVESNREFIIKGICGYRSADVSLLKKLKAGDYVYLYINKGRYFPSYDERVYILGDDSIEYLSLSNYDECETNYGRILILICTLIMIAITFSIRNDYIKSK